jgi:eukaryotic-like serine/threonine-protein kinase
MATVYLAVVQGPAGFNKLTVIKCLRTSLAAEPEFLAMFLGEARLAARINHPNVVQTNEVGFDGQYYYISMEYVEGPTLESIIRKAGATFPLPLHLNALVQALQGLHHAHELTDFDGSPLKVVHRDVSPHNVIVSYDGIAKLLDFGIAKAADSSENTRTGILKGKCAYMAPEQFGGGNIDRRADVFSAGVCLWQALTGMRLWKGLSDSEIFSRLSRGEIPSPTSVKPDLPPELVAICMRALSPDQSKRYDTAAALATELEAFIAANPAYASSTRDLATFVASLFSADRVEMKKTIDDQLRQVVANGRSLVSFSSDLASGELPTSTLMPAPPRRRVPLLVAIGLLLLSVAIVLVILRKKGEAKEPSAANANVVGAAQAKVTVRVVPDSAKIFFDDAPLVGNPASATLPRDGLSHRVRAEAPGFARKIELVVLDSSTVTVDLALDGENKGDEVDPFGNKLTAITAKAVPEAAHLYLDGVLLPTNPATAKYPRDGKRHEVKAVAVGFAPKTEVVTFDGPSSSLVLTLERLDPHAAAAVAPHPVAAPGRPPTRPTDTETPAPPPPAETVPPPAAPAPPPAAPATTQKPLDRGDPWAP